jgi:hypothetical protein
MKTRPTPTAVPSWNSPKANAFLDLHEDKEARLRATAWVRGKILLDNAAATRSEVAKDVLILGGVDIAFDPRWSVRQYAPERLHEVAIAEWLPGSQYWQELDAEMLPSFTAFAADYDKTKQAEAAAAQEQAAAHEAVREAQEAFHAAIESGADTELLNARKALADARKRLALAQR